ncbi:hypothetical protein CRG86_016545 [Photobacterium leiognathi]|nr:hypothetical protein CRG86_016545 [Photobacterium leiognathi]
MILFSTGNKEITSINAKPNQYTQAASRCLIQSEVTELNSRKTTKRNSELFPSCLTQEVGSVTRSQRASVLSSQTLLTILYVEPLYLRIVAAPEN